MRYFLSLLSACLFFVLSVNFAYADRYEPVLVPAETPVKAEAIFAGGCFWCMEPPFDKTPGVLETISGYIGGTLKNPTYKQVSTGGTGHYEALKVVYDPAKVTYQELLKVYWRNVDPFDARGQFCDKGTQYLSAIFAANEEEKKLAVASKTELEQKSDKKFVTRILDAAEFYPAETYHQDYYLKNPVRYKYYRFRCGRDQRLQEVWGAPPQH